MVKKSENTNSKLKIIVYIKDSFVPAELKSHIKLLKINILTPRNILKKDKSIILFATNFHLEPIQMNYLLLNLGMKLYNFCENETFHLELVGGDKNKEFNIRLGWELESYTFNKFKKIKNKNDKSKFLHKNERKIDFFKDVYFYIRDLINMPPNTLGPKQIYDSAKNYLKPNFSSKNFNGKLLQKEFPLIFAVGKGSTKENEPLFCEFKSRKKNRRKIYIIGKGVSFDTGGLNLKLGNGMLLMKKDMGGAANAIGLGKILSTLNLNVEVNVLLCLVENSLSEKSMRPSDIYPSRKGVFVEVSDTDAEGRLIMADALTYASENNPELVIDIATLTGASRVAMGLEIPSFFSNDISFSKDLKNASEKSGDPLWELPLWQNYLSQIKSNHADLKNIGNSSFGGAITAALFLEQFIKKDIPWIHIDLMAWSKTSTFSKYEGGEAMGIRALSELIKNRFSKSKRN